MYDTNFIANLLNKKINGTLSSEENVILEHWANLSPYNREIVIKVKEGEVVFEDVLILLEWNLAPDDQQFIDKVTRNVLNAIVEGNIGKLKRSFLQQNYIYIGSIVALILVVFSFWYYSNTNTEDPVQVLTDLHPIQRPAQIKLSNGHIITLDSNHSELIVGEVLMYKDGSVIADIDESKILDITLEIPKGSNYYIKLQDGTEVWLNSSSKLIYPSVFSEKERTVKLEGEAYFKVAKVTNKGRNIPFFVKSKQQIIEVVGTEFNVMAYAEDNVVESTLVEGAVKVLVGEVEFPIKPGEQLRNTKNNVTKHKVDIDQYLAWKNNTFFFHETKLIDALRVLSRWYDFEIDVNAHVPDTYIYAEINRKKGLSEVLKLMESGGLKFKIVNQNSKNKLIIDQ